MLRNTMWAGQNGLKALTATLKKNENKLKNIRYKIRCKYTTQPIDRHKLQAYKVLGKINWTYRSLKTG